MDTRNIPALQLLWLSSHRNVLCPHSHVQHILYLPNPSWEVQMLGAAARIISLPASSASISPTLPKHLHILLQKCRNAEIQKFRIAEIQKSRNSEIQRYRTQSFWSMGETLKNQVQNPNREKHQAPGAAPEPPWQPHHAMSSGSCSWRGKRGQGAESGA